jgi:hypothetical protein
MLCINTYPQEYIDECRSRVKQQVAAYKALVTAARKQGTSAKPLESAIESFDPVFFNNQVLLLDWFFVHRSRMLEKKDGNPANEVRVLCASLLNNDGKMGADKTIKLDPARSVLKYKVGDAIKLNEADFLKLSKAYFAEIESIYGE